MSDRSATFRQFIRGIEAGDRTLDFLHILLPHDPPGYLADGTFYDDGWPPGMAADVQRWGDDTYLVALAYQRYMQQTGFVDTLLGELVGKLRSVGKFDNALVIVTADHGKAYAPGILKRQLNAENASDILKVPLFIKLPGQTAGVVSDRPVFNADILPTIAGVLGEQPSWKLEGESAVAATFPERTGRRRVENKIATDGFTEVDGSIVRNEALLAWQLDKFGEGTPLSNLMLRHVHADLLGKPLHELRLTDQSSARIALAQADRFRNVDLTTQRLPALLTATLQMDQGIQSAEAIAVVLNGSVVATIPLRRDGGTQTQDITALLPVSAFRKGSNDVQFVAIFGTGADRMLAPIQRH